MDTEQAHHLASSLSSHDIAEAREARRVFARFLEPERLVKMWRDGQQDSAAALLREAEEVGSHDVYASLGDGFKRLFTTDGDRAVAEEFLLLDKTHIVARFLVASVSHEDLARASSMRPALLGLLDMLPPSIAPSVGGLLSASLKSDHALRLFDENRPESPENRKVCKFLADHTDLIPFIIGLSVEAFECDPLLFANYIAVCGIISRYMELPYVLLEKIENVLTEFKDGFLFSSVCCMCAVALRHHEENALKFAASWGALVLRHAVGCSVDTLGAIYDVLGSASTTVAGWSGVRSLVQVDNLLRMLGASTLRPIALCFLCCLVQSPHVADTFFGSTLLHAAWQLRNDVEDTVREGLWSFVDSGLFRESVMVLMAPLCASFLCSPQRETCVNVRSRQVQVAAHLMESGRLSPEVTERLLYFRSQGLYPPGSAGMEAMSRR